METHFSNDSKPCNNNLSCSAAFLHTYIPYSPLTVIVFIFAFELCVLLYWNYRFQPNNSFQFHSAPYVCIFVLHTHSAASWLVEIMLWYVTWCHCQWNQVTSLYWWCDCWYKVAGWAVQCACLYSLHRFIQILKNYGHLFFFWFSY